ncbi:MAG: hypothetical protein JST92_27095, partial [Deltaproteobacteria bacterium]|nr:hypothetical protein [Deltaproteobacteria bacterium]
MSPQVAAPLIFGLMVVMAIVVRAVHRRSEQARVQEEERLTAALGHQMMALQANAALKATAQAQLPEQASFAQPQLGAQAASMPQLGAPQAGRPPLRRPPSNPSADAESMLRAIAGAPSLHGPHVPPLTGQKLDKLA